MLEAKTFGATIDYNPKFPPENAKRAYVAKITGRATGALKFERDFLGESATFLLGDDCLIERQNGDKKGGATRWYNVILTHPEHGIINTPDIGEVEATKIAKLLDAGVSIRDAIEVTDIRPSKKYPDRMVFTAVVRSAAAAKKAAAAVGIDEAIESCVAILSALDAASVKKALATIKTRLTEGKQ